MSDFDPIKALREEISGIADVHKIIQQRTRSSEAAMAEAEADHNAALKLDAFLTGMLTQMRAKLRALEEAAEQRVQS